MILEPPPPPRFDIGTLRSAGAGIHVVNAVVAFLFAITGPVAIVLTAAQQGKLSEADIASWLFGAFLLNGLISLVFCLVYRQPLVFLWTIPGTILVGQALEHFSFPQVIGTYYATGALMLVLGLSGWVRACLSRVPMPIVMAMVAGVFLQFGLNLIFALRDGLAIAAPMTAVFLLLSAMPRVARLMPPVIGALIVGVAAIAWTGAFDLRGPVELTFAHPTLHRPEFSWAAMVELVLPLAITVLVAQNAQGFAVLEATGHKPPVNAVTTACGLGSLVAATVGAAPTCCTGPANAILVSSGDRERHYLAGVLTSILAILFGMFSPAFTQVALALPKVFVATLAGLAFLKVLERAFVTSFNGAFTFGASVAFLITVANVPVFSIGAPFWAVLTGFAVSWALERPDFEKLAAAERNTP
jgi:benzoate membrane transport protein